MKKTKLEAKYKTVLSEIAKPELIAICEKIRAKLNQSSTDEALVRYEVGKLVLTVKNDPAKYGTRGVEVIEQRLDMVGKRSLYRYADVVSAFPEEEFRKLIGVEDHYGRVLRWSHLVVLAKVDAGAREKWIEVVTSEGLSADALEERLALEKSHATECPPTGGNATQSLPIAPREEVPADAGLSMKTEESPAGTATPLASNVEPPAQAPEATLRIVQTRSSEVESSAWLLKGEADRFNDALRVVADRFFHDLAASQNKDQEIGGFDEVVLSLENVLSRVQDVLEHLKAPSMRNTQAPLPDSMLEADAQIDPQVTN